MQNLDVKSDKITVGVALLGDPQTEMKNQKGITLIALIITIIVMLILVGVTINVALNGGLFNKAEEATSKTKITQIQEALTIKRGEVLAELKGKTPENYGITLDSLNLPAQLKTEYGNKLIISKDGKLYYNASTVTNAEEQNQFKSMGIEEYAETNTTQLYSFTLNEMNESGAFERYSDGTLYYNKEAFWQTVGTDLSGQYGLNMNNGTLIQEMSTDSTELSFYTGVYSEGKFEFLFGEQNNNLIMMIAYYNNGNSKADYFDTNGGYSEILSRFGDVTIYFGVK